jgi:TolA-binding protein
MLALIDLKQKQEEEARREIDELLQLEGSGETHRAALLLKGELEMDQSHFVTALEFYQSAESDWTLEWSQLDSLKNGENLDAAYEAWRSGDEAGTTLPYGTDELESFAAHAIQEAFDLRRQDAERWEPGPLAFFRPSSDGRWARHQPTPKDLSPLDSLQTKSERLDFARGQLEYEIIHARDQSQRRQRYLEAGKQKTQSSLTELDRALAELEARLAQLDRNLAAMDSLQSTVNARIVRRTRRVRVELERNQIFLRALRQFWVDGPQSQRPERHPFEHNAGVVLEDELALATELDSLVTHYGRRMPDLVGRSFDEVLKPKIAGNSRSLHTQLSAQRSRGETLAAAFDSLMQGDLIPPRLLARRDSLRLQSERLRQEQSEVRAAIALRVARRGQEKLSKESESLDYHLADAAFEQAIEVAMDPKTNEQTQLVQTAREQAIGRIEDFLTQHPDSFTRGECRFRLADLKLLDARQKFQGRMASFLKEKPSDRQLNDRRWAPFIEYGPVVELYRKILAEDTDFPHLDAVLYALGMVLSDDGQAEGSAQLQRLVQQYPASQYAQEAWLRLGDERFNAKDYAAAVPLLRKAAGGTDASLSAIAYYKLGWAYYEQDRFLDAADGFRSLLDLYSAHEDLASSTDLRDEAEEYLVHSLVRGGGAETFASFFDGVGSRPYESRILATMGALLKSYSLYEESIACDRLFLSRYPRKSAALALAKRMVDSYGRWNRNDDGQRTCLELAPLFMEGGTWYLANQDETRREEALEFAKSSYRDAAVYWHQRAKKSDVPEDWRRALDSYETFLTHWPAQPESARLSYQAGEAATALGSYARAISYFTVAAGDTAAFAKDAAWQRVATADQWYESSVDTTAATSSAGADSLARKVLVLGDEYLRRYPHDALSGELRWREAQLAYRHAWNREAARRFGEMAEYQPDDERVPLSLRLQGDALHRDGAFKDAAVAYETALSAAVAAGQDSLALGLRPIIPLCYYENAESVARSDSSDGEGKAAPLFVELAQRFPEFAHADQSLYRGGLGYLQTDQLEPAVSAFKELLREHPKSDQARDAALQIAKAYESYGEKQEAALAYANFSRRFPQDADGTDALLRAAELMEQAGEHSKAEALNDEFLRRYPGEFDSAMEIREARAQRELQRVVAGEITLATLLTGRGGGAKTAQADSTASNLSAYLALAESHPDRAQPSILAQVEFLKAEAIHEEYSALKLTQPLPASIDAKKHKLEELLSAYQKCTKYEIRLYTHASAYRIGDALIEFGDALQQSQRPQGLNDDELLSYDEVLKEQSWSFYDRGEEAWNEMLRQNPLGSEDEGGWLAKTRHTLWPRVAQRFLHRPTVDYPLVNAAAPPRGSE